MHRRDLLKLSLFLMGSAASVSVSRAIQAGVNEITKPSATGFSQAQRLSVSLLSDIIIPPTDTPGAVTAGVPNFIETIFVDWYHDTERAIFLEGLKDIDAFCLKHEQKVFNDASEQTRVAALKDQESIASNYQPPAAGTVSFVPQTDENTPFFNKIKELVVLGYYTSEVGARQERIYLPVPGYYDGNFDFSKVGRQWTH